MKLLKPGFSLFSPLLPLIQMFLLCNALHREQGGFSCLCPQLTKKKTGNSVFKGAKNCFVMSFMSAVL